MEGNTSRKVAYLVKGVLAGFLIPLINGTYDRIANGLTDVSADPRATHSAPSLLFARS